LRTAGGQVNLIAAISESDVIQETVDTIKRGEEMQPGFTAVMGMAAMICGTQILAKMILKLMPPERRKRFLRRRAAQRWGRFSVKRWKNKH